MHTHTSIYEEKLEFSPSIHPCAGACVCVCVCVCERESMCMRVSLCLYPMGNYIQSQLYRETKNANCLNDSDMGVGGGTQQE